jgi:hypothetical protein
MEVHAPDRTSSLHMRLLDELDPMKRAAVHLELATMLMASGQFEQAGRHFREALHLDGSLVVARQRLSELGAPSVPRRGIRAWLDRRRA